MDQNNNGYGNYNGYNGFNGYNGYDPYNDYRTQYSAQPPQPPKKKRGGALGIVAASVSGAVIGGLAVGLVLGGMPGNRLSQQAYIDEAVQSALAAQSTTQLNMPDDGSVNGTMFNQVTTNYSDAIQQVVDKASPSVAGIATGIGTGTGVIVSEDGLILTNQHVIAQEDASLMFQPFGQFMPPQQVDSTITVTLSDGTEYEATVLFEDETMDLAVIKIEATGLTAATLGDSASVKVGEVTIAIGNPLGLEQTVTSGIVSALDRSVPLSNTQIAEDLIQTDAAINAGNSGGALLNTSGEVVGINSYKLSNGEGIGFAIPINAAKPILEQIIKNGEFKQAQIGLSMIDKELLNYYNYNEKINLDKGLYVYEVNADSDAYAKGLWQGDIITAVDSVEVNTILEFKTQIYKHLPGDSVTLTVQRDGSASQMTVQLTQAGQA